MSKDPANLEKALAKKARKAERKAQEKARKVRIETFHTGEVNISQAADWKLLGCWVNDDWDNYQSLNHLIIARQNGAGLIAAGVFLIDLACLGVKDAFARGFSSEYRFQHELLDHMNQMHTMQECTTILPRKWSTRLSFTLEVWVLNHIKTFVSLSAFLVMHNQKIVRM